MALTKTDLQAIRSIVKEEVKSEVSAQIETRVRAVVREEVTSQVSAQLQPINNTISQLISEFDQKLITNLEPIQKDLNILKKNSKLVVDFLNKEDIQLKNRVDRIETHLGLPPIS